MDKYGNKNDQLANKTNGLLEINLPDLQKTLDVQSLQLFSTQTQSLENRKKLAEQTKGEDLNLKIKCFSESL